VSECSESEESVLGSESSKRAFAVRSQQLARVAVISRVRSFIQLCAKVFNVIVICAAIISVVNKSGNQSEST
jgi:hypothetical protein